MIDAIKPILPHYNSGARKPYEPPPREEKSRHELRGDIITRYAAISQLLMDALVPVVSSYETKHDLKLDSELDDDHIKYVALSLGNIRRAQAALRLIATDIYT